jgi:hypothetical protein
MRNTRKPETELPEPPPREHLTEPEPEDPAVELPGWPGYRTQPEHSGLDPLESTAELGHVLGVLLKGLIYHRMRTRRPGLLLLMGVAGLVLLIPLVMTVYFLPDLGDAAIVLLALASLPAVLGILFWSNLVTDIVEIIQKNR